jgi:hypothetical protein
MSKTGPGGSRIDAGRKLFEPDRHPSAGESLRGILTHEEQRIGSMSAEERPYITCRELLDFLYLYLEDELPEDRRFEFDRHLAVCETCRDYLKQYRGTILLGRGAFEGPAARVAEDCPEELVRAVLEARRKV